jgi:hypothetical protein
VAEIDADLKYFWDQFRLSPTEILVSSQELMNIKNKVMGGSSGTSIVRFTGDMEGGKAVAGSIVGWYLNMFSMAGGNLIPITLHPNMPAGTIYYYTDRLPYKAPGVTNPIEIQTRQEYYQLEWPLKTRRYEYGVYADEVLKSYAPFSLGARSNIANG